MANLETYLKGGDLAGDKELSDMVEWVFTRAVEGGLCGCFSYPWMLWVLAVVVTLVSAVYQRTRPVPPTRCRSTPRSPAPK